MAWTPAPTTHTQVADQAYDVGGANFYRSGFYYHGAFTGMSTTGVSAGSNIRLRPFWNPVPRAFDRIGIFVTAASAAGSGGLLYLGIYSPGPVPGSLLASSGAMSSETTGAKEAAISVTLATGVYWVAVLGAVATCSVAMINSSEHSTPWASSRTDVSTSANPLSALVTNATFADLPTSLANEPLLGSAAFPLVHLRAA